MRAKPRIPAEDEPAHVRLLLAVRRTRKWTQRELAQELAVSTSTIAGWERGRTDPHPVWLASLRALLPSDFGG